MGMKGTRVFPLSWQFRRFRPVKTIKPVGIASRRIRLIDTVSLIDAIKRNPLLIFLTIFLLTGTILGALAARGANTALLNRLDFLFYCDYQTRALQAPAAIFAASLGSAFLFVFACFLCGLSMWGILVIPFILLFRGYGLGLATGYLYAAYGFSGVGFNLIVILPGAFLCVMSILHAAREGIYFSKKIAESGFHSSTGTDRTLPLKIYFARFGSIMILAAISAAVDLVMTLCFAGAFSF